MFSLDDVPNEVLENIALFVGSQEFLGPPSSLPTLLTLNRRTNETLSSATNPHLYARLFAAKFDISAPLRRLGKSAPTASALTNELRSRCIVLKRLRAQRDCRTDRPANQIDENEESKKELDDDLWVAYLMMLENDGKNAVQLRDYANIGVWLQTFWVERNGSSLTVQLIEKKTWPRNDTRAAVAMWLFWFFFDPGKFVNDTELKRQVMNVLRPYALGAHKYLLSALNWTKFSASEYGLNDMASTNVPHTSRVIVPGGGTTRGTPKEFRHFSLDLKLFAPPLALPAILSYLALRAKEDQVMPALLEFMDLNADIPGYHDSANTPDAFLAYAKEEDMTSKQSARWDCQWYSLGSSVQQPIWAEGNSALDIDSLWYNGTYGLGSMEGIWEGVFSYTEFMSYASLLSGAPPHALQQGLIAQHRQTWKLREYHLLAEVPYSSDDISRRSSDIDGHSPVIVNPFASSTELNPGNGLLEPTPLPQGLALRAHLPPASVLQVTESADKLTFTLPEAYETPPQGMAPFTTEGTEAAHRPFDEGPSVKYVYHRFHPENAKRSGMEGDASYAARVKDIILVGEGHSSWGEFQLIGRVRPFDGFVYLAKEYTGGDRGQWLYRGYLVGAGGGLGISASSSSSSSSSGANEGHFVGRWRDTITPANTSGYEGCFGLTRRR